MTGNSVPSRDRVAEKLVARRGRSMLALGRLEARLAVRHPVTIVAVLSFVGLCAYALLIGGANSYPVLQDEDRWIQYPVMVLLGGAALVVGNLAVLRGHRHGTTAAQGVLVLPVPWRVGAHLLAVLLFGGLATVLVLIWAVVMSTAPGAAGRMNPYELMSGPMVVVLLGALGVLLGQLFRSPFVAPLTLLGLAVATGAYSSPDAPGNPWLGWFLPVAAQRDPMPLPTHLLARPAAWHLGYLAGVLVLVIVAALFRAGGRRVGAAAVVGLLLAVGGGVGQVTAPGDEVVADRILASRDPARQQTCVAVDQVRYCVFPDFVAWVDGWDAVLRAVLLRVPPAEARRPMAVRQRVWAHGYLHGGSVVTPRQQQLRAATWRAGDLAAGTPNTVTVGTRWGEGEYELGLAALVAYEVLAREGAGVFGTLCGARAVLVGWLAGQASPGAATALREMQARNVEGAHLGEPSFGSGVTLPAQELALVVSLLDRPVEVVAAAVLRSWAELSRIDTVTGRAGEILGVPVPSAPADAGCLA
ncbi:hypothetical protein AB0M79_08865 [Polymorphospora sp. NPDC051019]|uniref:hypothetical protein n=1 Tax=Polymorphospora sp. NPDC051019 TaxID=3155725 RepID=UPI00343C0BC3